MVPRIGRITHLVSLFFYELLFYKSCHLSLSLSHMCACVRECTHLSLCMTLHTCRQYLDCVHNVYKCIYTNCHGIKVAFLLTDEMQLLSLTNVKLASTLWQVELRDVESGNKVTQRLATDESVDSYVLFLPYILCTNWALYHANLVANEILHSITYLVEDVFFYFHVLVLLLLIYFCIKCLKL